MLKIASVVCCKRGVEGQCGGSDPGVLRTQWPACCACISANPRPNRTKVVVRVDQFETLNELLEEKATAATPTC